MMIDFENKWLKMGGSNVTADGGAAGIFLGLDTTYKFYVGDPVANAYLKYNSTDGIVMSFGLGGTLTLIGDSSNPAKLTLVGDDGSVSQYIDFSGGYDNYYILPSVDGSMYLNLGTDAKRFNRVSVVGTYLMDFTCNNAVAGLIGDAGFSASVSATNTSTAIMSATYDGTNRVLLRAWATSSGGIIELDIDGSGYHNLLAMHSMPHTAIEDTTEFSTTGTGWVNVVTIAVYIPDYISSVTGIHYVYRNTSGDDCYVKFTVGGQASTTDNITNSSYAWGAECVADVSSLTGGWYELIISIVAQVARTTYLKGWAYTCG